MTHSFNNRIGKEVLNDFLVFGDDGDIIGSASEVMEYGPEWRRADGDTLLHLAATRCELQWIEKLVDLGWKPEVRNNRWGATPLQLLVMHESYRENPRTGDACLHALLRMGARVETQDDDGDAAIHYAVRSENIEAIKQLLLSGSQVNSEGSSASSPLDIAVRTGKGGNREIVQLLIEAGADVNHKNESGGTPLMWSAACNPEITRLLLVAGADPTIRDFEGETALDAACSEAADLIRESLGRR